MTQQDLPCSKGGSQAVEKQIKSKTKSKKTVIEEFKRPYQDGKEAKSGREAYTDGTTDDNVESEDGKQNEEDEENEGVLCCVPAYTEWSQDSFVAEAVGRPFAAIAFGPTTTSSVVAGGPTGYRLVVAPVFRPALLPWMHNISAVSVVAR